MSTPGEPFIIAKICGDLLIHCKDPEHPATHPTIVNLTAPTSDADATTFLVSSTILSTASSVFNAMLNSGFSESFPPTTPNTLRSIPLHDNPQALRHIFLALHHRNSSIPRKLTIEELYNIANILDKYDLYESLFPWLDLWCRKLQHRIGVDGKNEEFVNGHFLGMDGKRVKYADSRWLFISWVCRRGAIFRWETEYYLPRLRMMSREEAESLGEQEGVLTVYRRETVNDKEKWAVNPIAGLGEKVLEELWAERMKILDPVTAKLKLYYSCLQTAARRGGLTCVLGDIQCDTMGLGLLSRIMMALGIRDFSDDKEVEEVIGRHSIFDVKRIVEASSMGTQHSYGHEECQWLRGMAELSPEMLTKFKGLEPWGSTKKLKY